MTYIIIEIELILMIIENELMQIILKIDLILTIKL